jgi:hypothetical protein
MPSVAATMIEALPDDIDDRRAEEEILARDVAAVAYVGMSFSHWPVEQQLMD